MDPSVVMLSQEQLDLIFGKLDLMIFALRQIFTVTAIVAVVLIQEWIGGMFKRWMR